MSDVLDPILGAERWPPMLGVVGFDGGYRSAVALTLPPEGLVDGEGGLLGTGACCYNDGSCDDNLTNSDCTSAGGTYQGDGTDCGSSDCSPPTGACCLGCACTSGVTESFCVDGLGGVYQGDGSVCDPNPCPCPSIAIQLTGQGILCTNVVCFAISTCTFDQTVSFCGGTIRIQYACVSGSGFSLVIDVSTPGCTAHIDPGIVPYTDQEFGQLTGCLDPSSILIDIFKSSPMCP